MNKYDKFIEDCRKKKYPEGTYLEIHHIIPRHEGGGDEPENLIKLSLEDHLSAHLIRYEVYKNQFDLAMVLMRKNLSEKAWKAILFKNGITNTAIHKQKGITFWDLEFQKEMAQRSVNSEHAMNMRGVGGKKGGRTRNLNRIIIPQDKYLFYHNDQEAVCIFNCETGGDVLRELNKVVPTPLQRISQLLRGERKKLHGWACKPLNDVVIPEKLPPKIKRNSDPVKMKAAGKKAGKARHINKLITSNDCFEFSYNGQPLLCTLNCQTGGEIVDQLNLVKPNIRFKRVTALLNGTGNIRSGWSCQKIDNDIVIPEKLPKKIKPKKIRNSDPIKMKAAGKKAIKARHINKLITSNDCFEFSYNGQPLLCTLNCQTGGEIVDQLNLVKPNIRFKRVTALLKGTRNMMSGWSCRKIDNATGSLAPPRASKRGRACHVGKLFNSSDKFEFLFQDEPTVCLFNCETGGDIIRELTKVVPNSKFKRVTALFKGECKTLYGWSLKKLIREAKLL